MPANFLNSSNQSIAVFTDGSCHTQLKKGGWASILFIDAVKVVIQGHVLKTTHQRMELTAVLASLKYLQEKDLIHRQISIYSDSQYVIGLLDRKERLAKSNYMTKRLKPIRNSDLVQELIVFMGMSNIQFTKVKSHQNHSGIEALLNGEVDLLSRKQMRTNE